MALLAASGLVRRLPVAALRAVVQLVLLGLVLEEVFALEGPAGVISIPGMMTGQILAGEDPIAAARYRIVILFCIAGGVALGTVGVVAVAVRLAFDERGRLRLDRIRRTRAP